MDSDNLPSNFRKFSKIKVPFDYPVYVFDGVIRQLIRWLRADKNVGIVEVKMCLYLYLKNDEAGENWPIFNEGLQWHIVKYNVVDFFYRVLFKLLAHQNYVCTLALVF